jgi:cysteine desulfurase/selenocysteine lyase
MVNVVTYNSSTFDEPPARFEGGTPAIVQAIGLGEALEFIMNLGFDNIQKYEDELSAYTYQKLKQVEGLKILGDNQSKSGIYSFVIEGIHPHDLAFILNKEGIAVRVGHHCAAPLVRRLGHESVLRASLGMYNTTEDIDILHNALIKAKTFF